jgi:hypothetical protein
VFGCQRCSFLSFAYCLAASRAHRGVMACALAAGRACACFFGLLVSAAPTPWLTSHISIIAYSYGKG